MQLTFLVVVHVMIFVFTSLSRGNNFYIQFCIYYLFSSSFFPVHDHISNFSQRLARCVIPGFFSVQAEKSRFISCFTSLAWEEEFPTITNLCFVRESLFRHYFTAGVCGLNNTPLSVDHLTPTGRTRQELIPQQQTNSASSALPQ